MADLIYCHDQARLASVRETGAETGTVPTSRYFDRVRWQEEQDTFFAQWPIVAAHHSPEVPLASALAFDALVLNKLAAGTLEVPG